MFPTGTGCIAAAPAQLRRVTRTSSFPARSAATAAGIDRGATAIALRIRAAQVTIPPMRWDYVVLALIVGVPFLVIAVGSIRGWLGERAFLAEWHAGHPDAPRHHNGIRPTLPYDGRFVK
jgi:hypothetical protein